MHQRRYFGTDGIRDLANTGNLRPDSVLAIGHAIGRVVREKASGERRPAVLLVRDTRISGPMIAGILSGAILGHGVDVHDGGVLPTPAAAMLVRRMGLDLGIVVSASHNAMPDNGIKLFGPDGRKLSDDTEIVIERYIDQGASHDVDVTGANVGRLFPFPEGENRYFEAMVEECFKDLDLGGLELVLDCAHGSGSRVSPRILASLGAEVHAVHDAPDGLNINENAGVFHASALGEVVVREGAAAGFALDGDGDRVIMVDETGRVLDGDDMLAILAGDLDPEGPGLVATVMSNMGLKARARALGLELHETPVGDRYVSEKMAATGAVLGGEQSGHIIFRTEDGWHGDGLYTALRVLGIARREGVPLSRLAGAMERFPQVLVNVAVSEKPPTSEIPALQEAIRKSQVALAEDGRILVRYSGTESLARVMVEGRDERLIRGIADEIAAVLRREIG